MKPPSDVKLINNEFDSVSVKLDSYRESSYSKLLNEQNNIEDANNGIKRLMI